MKKIGFIHAIIIGFILYSCQTVNVIPIDYLVPADISFPSQIKRVAIVNNVSEPLGRIHTETDSILLDKTNGFFERYRVNGDPRITTESLAEAVAAENYFNEVVVCDSALQVSGATQKEATLNKKDVNELIKTLDVDMLIALEEIQIIVQKQVYPMGEMGFLGNTDAKVYPKVNLYIPNRHSPLVMINGSDSIFWEGLANSVSNARTKVISDEQLINEASDFAGTIPTKYMTPHWNTVNRYYFANGSSEMRDAAFFIQSNNWDKAFTLWERAYETQKGKKKARIASNISLYYEMKDDLEKAEEWGKEAIKLIKVANNITEDSVLSEAHLSGDLGYIYYNQVDLSKRKESFAKLKMQMDRFNDDF
ncbi:DUF6340 family protein [Bacteroides sp. 51]|uniref:DUF6340 family protein n=1 Tax=Bacteroides sp. 51 TaxID=2302938 RepID=UPI0013D6BDC1|nr:DUF6340 family protein [Bacteroides sp. 51]NDV82392.1 tetratricopeptide repeat protein [Bacteroides sp. 51]